MVRHLPRTITGIRNWRRTRLSSVDGPTWSMRAMRAPEFRFVVHVATVGDTVLLLGQAGLQVRGAWSEAGVEIDVSSEHHDADYVHHVCAPTALRPPPGSRTGGSTPAQVDPT